jgi:hypothetical protein
MQDQLDVVKEIISIFLKDSKDGKKRLVEWFLTSVMKEEARIQISTDPYERTDEQKMDSIVALKRNMSVIDCSIPLYRSFMYHGMGINSSFIGT